MRLIRQPNQWTCGPCAYAMAMGVSLQDVFDAAGHDGSEVLYPDRPEPACRRAFHAEDLTLAALRLGFGVVKLTTAPQFPDGRPFTPYPSIAELFECIWQHKHRCVLVVESRRYDGLDHCIAWGGKSKFLDPQEGVLSLEDLPPVKFIELVFPFKSGLCLSADAPAFAEA